MSDYELVPFKLKELPPRKEPKDPLDTMRVVSTLKDPPKRQINPHMGFRLGYPFLLATLGDRSKTKLPYVSVFWRDRLFGQNVFYELDISYFSFKNKASVLGFINNIPVATNAQSHALPVTANILYQLHLTDWLSLSPKAGLGYMPVYSRSPDNQTGFPSLLVMKPTLELEFILSKRISIHLENTLLVGLDMKGFDFSFFYIPNVGVSYGF